MAHEPLNLANAVIIIGAVYFMQSGFNWWLLALIGFAIATWGHWHQTADTKKLTKLGIKQTEANIKQIEANIQNLNAATAITVANVKIIAGKLKQ